ncbi:tRNA (guanine-N7-)-methyltransferase [Catenuloplanes atrovinosus]|uniref:tRNA (guanine-N(7)-)-methyltransferase n=2 Tax=Catenuloplanes atrovinosus TaxID=137266 RepID=A0AAE3YJ62_9ACTN|nr:tRNA (guanine-N7-)-methyltransferase [Catenuloplanes atrovinosus]
MSIETNTDLADALQLSEQMDALAEQINALPPARVRTFHPRRGRMSPKHHDALERLWESHGVDVPLDPAEALPLDLAALFGREAPTVLEIGSGMGEATVAMAAADPDRDYLAVEVHTPGVGNLLSMTERRGLTNVRVALGDALTLVGHQLAPASLDAIHVFFPDPWPKARHHKRRLIQPAHLGLLRSRLRPGGILHCATDWAEYAEAMLTAMTAEPGLTNDFDRFAPRPDHRPMTKFERRGITAHRRIYDLIFRRTPTQDDQPQ